MPITSETRNGTEGVMNTSTGQWTNAAYYGGPPVGSSTNPALTSADTTNTNNALGRDIQSSQAESQRQAAYAAEGNRLRLEGEKTVADINKSYAQSTLEQGQEQESRFASRATNLITSGGGFLGATQSQEGVLQNLKGTFEQEKNALLGKRDSAILAAQSAYADKEFDVAKEMMASARDAEKQAYQREQDYYTQQARIMGLSEKKAEAYSLMDDASFAKLSQSQLNEADGSFYSGYTRNLRDLTQKANTVKTQQDQVNLDRDILSTRLQMPLGKKFTLGGVTYTGMKQKEAGSSGTQSDRDMANKQKVQSWFTSATKIPGTDGIPFLSGDGKATPEGWQTAYEYSGMDRRKFIIEFGYLLASDGLDDEKNPLFPGYGLTLAEMKLVNTVVPVIF